MLFKKLTYGITLLLLMGCRTNNEQATASAIEQLNLVNLEDKKQYLEKIFEDDQKVRGSHGQEIMLKFGKDSEEHRNYVQIQIDQDALNLKKVEQYLAQYGHPKESELGEIATITPWAVIHHANSYEERERNFVHLYRAYLQGDLDDGAISMFLGRMYQMQFGERFEMESPFKSEDEINALIEKLDLVDKKRKAQETM